MNDDSPWSVIGPGGGGAQFLPTVSPHDPRTVLVACDMTGSYITHDAGASWRMFNLRQPTRFFVFDPVDPKTIYAKSDALWQSRDSGATWHLLHPAPENVAGIAMAGDHAETHLLLKSGGDAEDVTALAVDPHDAKILYAAVERQGGTSLMISQDRGKSWKQDRMLPDGARHLYVAPGPGARNSKLFIVGRSTIAQRARGVLSSGHAEPQQEKWLDCVLGFTAQGEAIAYAITKKGLFVSPDGGSHWNESHLPGESPAFVAVATSLHHPEVAYVSYQHLKREGEEWFGVARTTDRGRTWQTVWQESNRPADNLHDAWVSPTFGPGWGENPLALGADPIYPQVCYATDYGRTLRTTDGGKTWEAVYSRRLADGSFATAGLDVTTSYGVHFDPFDPKRLFITYTDIGLFRSENGGKGWLPSFQGVPRKWVNTAYWVAFDPEVRGRMWVVMSGVHDLPRPKMWRNRSLAAYNGGVCQSDDGGKTWRVLNNGLPETAATHILLDPRSPKEARTLYVAAFGRGVYKSVDGGKSWALKRAGLEGDQPMAWRLTLAQDGTLYLAVSRRSENGRFGNEGDGALYRSTDGAERWTKIALPHGVNGPNGLTVDPTDARRLYLATWARDERGTAKDGGIFLSVDGGGTWKSILSDPYLYDVTVDPRDPKILYACGFGSSAWKSTDRGATWKRLRGYNFKWGHRVIPDPHDPTRIYVTTFGGSVWHGPADGDPNAAEDIVSPPALRYSR